MLKAKLILIAFCISVAIAAHYCDQSYANGWHDGIASIDQEAFESYTHFARQMQHEVHRHPKDIRNTKSSHDEVQTVWTAIDGKGK